MIVYCAGAIRGDTKYRKSLLEIIDYVKILGHTALSEFNESFKVSVPLTDKEIYKRDIKWLERSQLVIADVSGTSTGVGFEISYALFKLQKPVLAIANDKSDSVSALIKGCNSILLTYKNYSDYEELKKIISSFINKFNTSSEK
jgi:nucleoside 2-deoxyribosyltransferase